MSIRIAGGFVVLALVAGQASAAIENRTVVITNNTAVGFSRVSLYIAAVEQAQDLGPWLAVEFVNNLTLQNSVLPPSDKSFPDAPTGFDRVFFDFQPQQLQPGGTFIFNVTVDNPFNAPFTIGHRTFEEIPPPVPAPASALGLLGVAGLVARRRR